jgi:hypothetical protein
LTDSIGRLGNGAKTVFSFRRAVRELGRRLERILWIMCYGRRGGAWVYFGVVGKDRPVARGGKVVRLGFFCTGQLNGIVGTDASRRYILPIGHLDAGGWE